MIPNLFSHFESIVKVELEKLAAQGTLPCGLDLSSVAVEPPRDAAHGDISTNAAMVLAKAAAMKPRDIAEPLAERLRLSPGISSAEIAGPGFLNLVLEPSIWAKVLATVLAQGDDYGAVDIGRGEKVNVEYVSANPTGPMHVGHCRGAVVGDALAALLARAGYDVTREYYINDAGAQVDVLARSVFMRYREALGEQVGDFPAGLYPGDYLVPVGQALAKTHGKALAGLAQTEWLPIVRAAAIDAMMDMIRTDLARLNIHHDVFFSERSLIGEDGKPGGIARAIEALRSRDLVYEGRLPPPKGRLPDDWEDREQLLFRATQFGDDVDRPLLKSDGSHTYFAADIAYHFDKFERGFANQIDVWGADHSGYVKRMKAAVEAITGGKGELDVKICQLVRLLRAGEPVKMSKRSGEFVTLADVVAEVGADPVRFMMLY
ncbi:Arginyl-tRNA synthetase, partial [hydrothermal vent metagenome]